MKIALSWSRYTKVSRNGMLHNTSFQTAPVTDNICRLAVSYSGHKVNYPREDKKININLFAIGLQLVYLSCYYQIR